MDYRRLFSPGGTFFFTVVTHHRKPVLVANIDRLRAAVRRVKADRPFSIDAAVVLPDHLHMVWTLPEGDADYSMRWNLIKRHFSAGFPAQAVSASKRTKREKGIWQRRFWEHQIRDEQDWRNHLDYIHFNPVKHGHVQQAIDWPYCSFRRYVRQGFYEPDWGQSSDPVLPDMEFE